MASNLCEVEEEVVLEHETVVKVVDHSLTEEATLVVEGDIMVAVEEVAAMIGGGSRSTTEL